MKTKMKVLLMSLCAAFVMLAGSGVTVHAEEFSAGGPFEYAYDVQRTRFPEKGGTITCSGLSNPYIYPMEVYEKTEGDWTLTEIGSYEKAVGMISNTSNLFTVVSDISNSYDDLNLLDVCIHELKDGDTHIAYGVIVVSDESDKVVFIGDSLGGGAGYLLSKNEIAPEETPVDVTGVKIAPDYAAETEKKIVELDVTDSYTFYNKEEGYTDPAGKEVTVTNISSNESGALEITLEGNNAECFELSKTAMDSIASGASDTFKVIPKEGLGIGTYTATITVKAAADNTLRIAPQSFTVSLTVIASQTPEPSEPTPAPEEPTPAPAEPTPAPAEPTATPAPVDNSSSDSDDDDATPAPVVATPAPEVLYTVQKGDCLWRIARLNGCSLTDLMVANADLLHFRSLIYPNWVLRIPGSNTVAAAAQPTAAPATTQLYKVQKGDSLWKIARNHKCSVRDIMDLNNIAIDNADLIYPGWDLTLPEK